MGRHFVEPLAEIEEAWEGHKFYFTDVSVQRFEYFGVAEDLSRNMQRQFGWVKAVLVIGQQDVIKYVARRLVLEEV